jgi:hypothetical protein
MNEQGGVHAAKGILRGGFMFNGTLPDSTSAAVTPAKRKKKGKGKKSAKAK